MYIYGILEDSATLISLSSTVSNLYSTYSNLYGYPDGVILGAVNYAEPLSYVLFYLLTKVLPGPITWDILLAATMLLNFVSFAKLLSVFVKSNFVKYLTAFVFMFHPFFLFQAQSHLALLQIWPLFLILYLLLDRKYSAVFVSTEACPNKRHRLDYKLIFKLTLLIALQVYLSTYLGFLSLFIVGYFAFVALVLKNKYGVFTLALTFIASLILILPLFYSFFFVKPTYGYYLPTERFNRPLGDFVTFSTRPWYFFIPPADSVLMGKVGTASIKLLESNFDSILFKNYFVTEHATSYLGVTSIVLVLLYVIYKRKVIKFDHLIVSLIILNILILFLSLPPILPIAGKSIPLPSYIVYNFLPFLRVLARFSIINVVFITLLVASILQTRPKYQVLLVLFLIMLEFIVPFKITKIDAVPNNFEYIKNLNSPSFAVYPYSYSGYSSFWVTRINKALHNPRDFYYKNGDYSLDITNGLTKCINLQKMKHHTDVLLVFEDENTQYFDKNMKTLNINKIACFSGLQSREHANDTHKLYKTYYPSKTMDSCIYMVNVGKCE